VRGRLRPGEAGSSGKSDRRDRRRGAGAQPRARRARRWRWRSVGHGQGLVGARAGCVLARGTPAGLPWMRGVAARSGGPDEAAGAAQAVRCPVVVSVGWPNRRL